MHQNPHSTNIFIAPSVIHVNRFIVQILPESSGALGISTIAKAAVRKYRFELKTNSRFLAGHLKANVNDPLPRNTNKRTW